jgi:hypothetical protein
MYTLQDRDRKSCCTESKGLANLAGLIHEDPFTIAATGLRTPGNGILGEVLNL